MLAIEAANLSKVYHSQRGFFGASFEIERGEIIGFLGPNGSGKSTLLKVLATCLRPTSGAFRILGVDGLAPNSALRQRLGVLFEGVAHFGDLSGFDNAWFFAMSYGMEPRLARSRLEELFLWAGLNDYKDSRVKTYSYGMKRKLALIEALVHQPDVLLLDEPSLGLDYVSTVALYQRLAELASTGTTVVLATNNVFEAEKLCSKVALIDQGRLVALDSPKNFLKTHQDCHQITMTLAEPIDHGLLSGVPLVRGVVGAEQNVLQIVVSDVEAALPEVVTAVVQARGRIVSLKVSEPNLGDVFIAMTGAKVS
ncbi:MAG: ABC transporter ATP-binding protein [Chloroflexi bacterium]|nr:ABC transporter ATP-binding protein [Chloroflexota bacterium]